MRLFRTKLHAYVGLVFLACLVIARIVILLLPPERVTRANFEKIKPSMALADVHIARSVHQAIAEYERVLQLKPDLADAHFELAGALLVNAQFREAAEHFQMYLQHHPDDVTALVGLANCQVSLGQLEAAQATLGRSQGECFRVFCAGSACTSPGEIGRSSGLVETRRRARSAGDGYHV